MRILSHDRHGPATALAIPSDIPVPFAEPQPVLTLLAQCPAARQTPLLTSDDLARRSQVAWVGVKDERTRMGLGSFKALGAAFVIASDAVATGADDFASALAGLTYVTASAGNHGLSVASGARVFGANALVYISDTVPESFADRLRAKGADVIREGADYAQSMAAAEAAATANGWQLLSDSSWQGYVTVPQLLMQGYLALIAETAAQIVAPPTHILVQAGVGGLACAVAAHVRKIWGDAPRIIVVEPDAAPALFESIRAGRPVVAPGPVSIMGRLDCKEASLIALKGLARDADLFVTLTEDEAASALPILAEAGLATTPSGGAGLAALLASAPHRLELGLDRQSRVLCFLSETAET